MQKIKCAKNNRKFEKNVVNTKKDIGIQTMFPYPDQEEFVESVERAAEYQSAPVQQLSWSRSSGLGVRALWLYGPGMISVKGDFLRCGWVRVGACREGMWGMHGECVKLEHRFGSGSRQCCTIGLDWSNLKQPDWRNVCEYKFWHPHHVLYSWRFQTLP